MIWLAQYTTFCTTAKLATFFFQIIFYLVDSIFKLTTRNSAMICFLALFALFGSIWSIELSVGKDAEVNLFEADCTIIMVTQHIPTMTNSHHGGFLSVMIMVGICQVTKSHHK